MVWRRRLGALVVVAMLASACGAPAARTTASPSSTATLSATNSAVPTPAATPAATHPPKAAEMAAQRTWRRWASAMVRGQLQDANRASRDGANSWTVITQVVADSDRNAGQAHTFSGTLRGESVLAGNADAVLLRSTLNLRETAPNGLDRHIQITKPLLHRYAGEWFLVSFSLLDQPLHWTAIERTQEIDGVRLEVIAVLGLPKETWLVTRTTVLQGSRRFTAGGGSLVRRDGATVLLVASAFSGDARPVGVWRFPETGEVHGIHLALRESGTNLRFDFGSEQGLQPGR